mmetsp:Transcript_20353/g.68281  ORF Transcript_20353/g.68281 Transcript_20353/m.68281 type:complete len:503 (+) Transcript_20353:74-1582(+)
MKTMPSARVEPVVPSPPDTPTPTPDKNPARSGSPTLSQRGSTARVSLDRAKADARRFDRTVRYPLLYAGFALLTLAMSFAVAYGVVNGFRMLEVHIALTLGWPASVCLMLALLPTDSPSLLRKVAWLFGLSCVNTAVLFAWPAYLYARALLPPRGACWLVEGADPQPIACGTAAFQLAANTLLAGVLVVAASVFALELRRPSSARRTLTVLWAVVSNVGTAALITYAIRLFGALIFGDMRPTLAWGLYWALLVEYAAIVLALRAPRAREAVHAALAARGEAVGTAAGIASLLGDRTTADTLAHAHSSFRAVPADRVAREDLSDNTPSAALQARSVPCKLGSVDAFVSHSWQDDADAKYAELCTWADAFRKEHHREPLLWIDRFCIVRESAETDISDSLACLPVYLAGCDTFLALCGDTYLRRLWCLVEAWCFVEMRNGRRDGLVFRPFGGAVAELERRGRIDVSRADCTQVEDTERLTDVLKASFGSMARCSDALTRTLLDD